MLPNSGGVLFAKLPPPARFEFIRALRRLMTKLATPSDVEIRTSEGHLKLTATGLEQLARAKGAAPALWASLQ